MKFTITTIIAILPLLTMASPAPEPEPALSEPTVAAGSVKERSLAKRSVTGTVQVDGLNHRSCPRTSCTSNGEYFKGDKIQLSCYTRVDTTVVDGDAGWAKVTSNGDWVALAYAHYVSWAGTLYSC